MVVTDVHDGRLVAHNRRRQSGECGGAEDDREVEAPLTDVAQERPGGVLAGVEHDPGCSGRPALEQVRHEPEPRGWTQAPAQQPAR